MSAASSPWAAAQTEAKAIPQTKVWLRGEGAGVSGNPVQRLHVVGVHHERIPVHGGRGGQQGSAASFAGFQGLPLSLELGFGQAVNQLIHGLATAFCRSE